MRTWKEYEKHVKATNLVLAKDMEEAERMAEAITSFWKKQKDISLSRRILDGLTNRK